MGNPHCHQALAAAHHTGAECNYKLPEVFPLPHTSVPLPSAVAPSSRFPQRPHSLDRVHNVPSVLHMHRYNLLECGRGNRWRKLWGGGLRGRIAWRNIKGGKPAPARLITTRTISKPSPLPAPLALVVPPSAPTPTHVHRIALPPSPLPTWLPFTPLPFLPCAHLVALHPCPAPLLPCAHLVAAEAPVRDMAGPVNEGVPAAAVVVQVAVHAVAVVTANLQGGEVRGSTV